MTTYSRFIIDRTLQMRAEPMWIPHSSCESVCKSECVLSCSGYLDDRGVQFSMELEILELPPLDLGPLLQASALIFIVTANTHTKKLELYKYWPVAINADDFFSCVCVCVWCGVWWWCVVEFSCIYDVYWYWVLVNIDISWQIRLGCIWIREKETEMKI